MAEPTIDADDRAYATSFEAFFEAERRRLFRAMYAITGSVAEAEELTQDAFLKVWERWDRVSTLERPVGYLYRVALNASSSRYRRMLTAAKHVVISTAQTEDPYPAVDARDAVVRAIRDLTPRQRGALVVTELFDLGAEQAGEILGVKASTVRNLVAQAHAAMRAAMEMDDE